MANNNELIVGGYYFGSFEDAKTAEKEIKNAEYIDERLKSMKPNQRKALYDKMLDQKVFTTPVGWEYLKYLKGLLVESGIPEEDIRPVPIYVNFSSQRKEMLEDIKNPKHIAREKITPLAKKTKGLEDRLKLSLCFNAVLIVLVILMFVITLKSDNPNILNYEQAITNKYSTWQQELDEREKQLDERERSIENTGR